MLPRSGAAALFSLVSFSFLLLFFPPPSVCARCPARWSTPARRCPCTACSARCWTGSPWRALFPSPPLLFYFVLFNHSPLTHTPSQTFLTLLSSATAPRLEALLSRHVLRGGRASELLRAPPQPPGPPGSHVLFEHYWLEAGPEERPEEGAPDAFVLVPSVRRHLATLARAALLRRHPILLQARGLRMCCVRAVLRAAHGSRRSPLR